MTDVTNSFMLAIESAASELTGQRKQINEAWDHLREGLRVMHPDFDLDDDGQVFRSVHNSRAEGERREPGPAWRAMERGFNEAAAERRGAGDLLNGSWLCECGHWNRASATACRVCITPRERGESASVAPVESVRVPEPAGEQPVREEAEEQRREEEQAAAHEASEGTYGTARADREATGSDRTDNPPAEKPAVRWRKDVGDAERRRYMVYLSVLAMRNLTVQEVMRLLDVPDTDANKGKYGDDLRELARRGSLRTEGTRWPEGTTTGKKSLAYVPGGAYKDRDGNTWNKSQAFAPDLALPPQ